MPAAAPVAPLGRGNPSTQDVNLKAIKNVIRTLAKVSRMSASER